MIDNLARLDSLESIDRMLQTRFKDFKFSTLSKIPHISELGSNMEASLSVVDSMFENEKILIVGDYDADGICAISVVMDFFDMIGYKNVISTMPNRFRHGYGFSRRLLDEVLQSHSDIRVVITVDNGVSSFEAGAVCRDMGIKLIITDHHRLEQNDDMTDRVPPCDFIINPMSSGCPFPFKEICGSLVAWYFCSAIRYNLIVSLRNLLRRFDVDSGTSVDEQPGRLFGSPFGAYGSGALDLGVKCSFTHPRPSSPQACGTIPSRLDSTDGSPPAPSQPSMLASDVRTWLGVLDGVDMRSLLPLVGIATISDVMNLSELNHTICKYAIQNFYKFERPAFNILRSLLRGHVNSQSFGFKLAPLLNSAGRLSDGSIALDFLRAKTLSEAREAFVKLKILNDKRREIQDLVCRDACEFAKTHIRNPHIMLSLGEDWHEGVLGIAAGRLADEFNKPSFVLTSVNGVYKGSGRSNGSVDLIASIQRIGNLFNRYGGHAGAVGLEISRSNVDLFVEQFEPVPASCYASESSILGYIDSDIICLDLLNLIQKYEPYGYGNERPMFYTSMRLHDLRMTGNGFLQFRFIRSGGGLLKAMLFNKNYDMNRAMHMKGRIVSFSFSAACDFFDDKQKAMVIIDKIYDYSYA